MVSGLEEQGFGHLAWHRVKMQNTLIREWKMQNTDPGMEELSTWDLAPNSTNVVLKHGSST